MRRSRHKLRSFERLEERLALSTYYVSNQGNDAQNGSASTPWATLQKAANTVNAGDTVVVRAGTYAGFDLQRDGTVNSRITFSAEAGVTINQRNARTPDGINLEGADFVTVEGFTVVGVTRAGIRTVTNNGVIIRNNRCDQNGSWGILTGFSENVLIENNECSRSAAEHGIYVSNSGDHPTVRGNVLWGNNANGLHMNGDVFSGGDGIITGALVENNVIYDNGRAGGSGINCDGVQGSRIQNNLLYNNHASGISLYRIDGGGGSTGNIVIHNTVIVASDGRWALNISGGSTGNTAYNNILYSYHSFRGSISITADSLPGFTSNYNSAENQFSADGGNTTITFAQWLISTGRDTGSFLAAPADLFTNVATADYRLKAGSPAIDRGTLQFAPNRDLAGNPRPNGLGYDVGAYEIASVLNRAPTAVGDTATTAVNIPAPINVLANDTDPDGDPLWILSYTQPAHGSVTLVSGTLLYSPAAGYVGSDGFTYSISDARGGTSSAAVSVTVQQAQPTSVSVVGGRLVIRGGVGSDVVTITGTGNGMSGQYVIVTSQGTQTVNGIIGDMDIDLSAGDDQLTMENTFVNGTITISTGAGNDTVVLGAQKVVSTRLALVVALGDNNDILNGTRLYIGGNQTISGGDGNDQITFLGSATGAFVLGTSSGGATTISGDGGDDAIHASYSFIVGAWQVNGGAGHDWATIRTSACSGAVSVLGEAGADQIIVEINYFVTTLLIDGGADDDRIALATSLGMTAATIQGRGGADTVLVNNLTAKRLTVNTGTEVDGVEVRSSLFDELFASLGDQDDVLQLFGNLVKGTPVFDGGAGSDTFYNLGNAFRGGYQRISFER